MADDCADCGDHHPTNIATGEMRGEPHGEVALPSVEKQSENSGEGSGVANDVGGADIAAADFADVWAAERFYDEQTERESRREGRLPWREEPRGADENRVQFVPSTNGNAASLLYCAPDDFSTLSNR